MFTASGSQQHDSEVSIVSSEGQRKQDLRLYHRHRSCVNEGMHRELEKALLVSQQQSTLETELVRLQLVFL